MDNLRMNCQKTQGKVLQNVHQQEEFKSTVHTKALQLEKGVSGALCKKENSFWKIICAGSADTYWGMEKVMARDGRGARLYSQ